MNQFGWTSWGWLDLQDGNPLRRWKWHGRSDVYVNTNDENVLAILASALIEMEEQP